MSFPFTPTYLLIVQESRTLMTAPLVQSDGAGREDLRAAEGSYIYSYIYMGLQGMFASEFKSRPLYSLGVSYLLRSRRG